MANLSSRPGGGQEALLRAHETKLRRAPRAGCRVILPGEKNERAMC